MSKTSKPCSTISYNTESFLKDRLSLLLENGSIDDYRYIYHFGEGVTPSGDPKKNHFHLILFPSCRLDLNKLIPFFNEPDLLHPDKPLTVIPFRHSEPLHWIRYVLHDPDYLASHSDKADGDGKIVYPDSKIVYHCEELFQQDLVCSNAIRTNCNQKALSLALRGESFSRILCEVPRINPVALSSIIHFVQSKH